MKEYPITFTGEMVRALLSGAKTQTRRVVKPQPDEDGLAKLIDGPWQDTDARDYRCPYGVPGDVLWWANEPIEFINLYEQDNVCRSEARIRSLWDGSERIVFTPGAAGVLHGRVIKRPKLGRWRGRRLPIEWARDWRWPVTDVRVERVHSISDADVLAEGVEQRHIDKNREWFHKDDVHALAFAGELWEPINKKRGYGWTTNPWVWAVSFRRTKP